MSVLSSKAAEVATIGGMLLSSANSFINALPEGYSKYGFILTGALLMYMIKEKRLANEKLRIEIAILAENHRVMMDKADKKQRVDDKRDGDA